MRRREAPGDGDGRSSRIITWCTASRIRNAWCWAHIRRKFVEAARSVPALESWSARWVERIAELYRRYDRRAANWIRVGDTQGRGKTDGYHQHARPIKTIWVYPLHRQYCALLTAPLDTD